jgi:hypothetical protein
VFSSYLEFRLMDKVHKPIDYECCTQLSDLLGSTIKNTFALYRVLNRISENSGINDTLLSILSD